MEQEDTARASAQITALVTLLGWCIANTEGCDLSDPRGIPNSLVTLRAPEKVFDDPDLQDLFRTVARDTALGVLSIAKGLRDAAASS